jgi:hypothetical protein
MKTKYMKIVLAILLVCCQLNLKAQSPSMDTPDATSELLKLQAVFQNISYTSFNVTYYYEEDDSTGILRDTMNGQYMADKDRYYYILDSIEQIQNETYKATIDHSNSTIYIEKPFPSYTSVLQANMLDSAFLQYNVDSMTVADSGTFRKVNIYFKAESPYLYYQYCYDMNGIRPAFVKFSLRKQQVIPDDPQLAQQQEQFVRIHIVFSNFTTGEFTDKVFNTDRFFKRVNGVFVQDPTEYNSYEIANAYDQQ